MTELSSKYKGKKQCDYDWLYHNYVILKRPRKEIAEECGIAESTLKTHLYKKRIVRNGCMIEKKDLEKAYLCDNLTFNEMNKMFGCSDIAIRYYLNKYNIPRRESLSDRYSDSDVDEMLRLYIDEKMSANQIAQIFDTTHTVIIRKLKSKNIKTRTTSESQWNYNKKTFPQDLLDKGYVTDLYINNDLSKKDIGKMFDCEPTVIDRILRLHEIPIRGKSEANIGRRTGENHPNWQGGLTSLSQRLREFFIKHIAKKALKRDKYTCQLCKSRKNLHVHHVVWFSEIVKKIISECNNLALPEDIDELYTIVTKDKRFLDVENLKTYCSDCHWFKIHGYKKQSEVSCDEGVGNIVVKGVVEEDFTNYKLPCMILLFPLCDFKCGKNICHNHELTEQHSVSIDIEKTIEQYLNNSITSAIVCSGLEPFDSGDDLMRLVKEFRKHTNDNIVIYSGYDEKEIDTQLLELSKYSNIIVKFGRYIPNQEKHYDKVLGVELASQNQYAKEL